MAVDFSRCNDAQTAASQEVFDALGTDPPYRQLHGQITRFLLCGGDTFSLKNLEALARN